MLPVQPTCSGVSARPAALVSTPESAPTSVTSRPSRIQVTPSALTTSQWKRRQGSASSRAGTSVVTVPGSVAGPRGSACAMLGQTAAAGFGCAVAGAAALWSYPGADDSVAGIGVAALGVGGGRIGGAGARHLAGPGLAGRRAA